MTTPTDQVVIRDPLTNNLLRSYTQDGDKWNWTWVSVISAAKTFDRAEAERIVQESGQIMYRVEDPQVAAREGMKGSPSAPSGPEPAPVISIKPPAPPKPMEYKLFAVTEHWVSDDPAAPHIPQNSITAAMAQGWKLYGPPFMRNAEVMQAMIREIPLSTPVPGFVAATR
jgi:hypothetical protein